MEAPTFKDVVIVGNGPSGITLSYMLAGNQPFYNGFGHPIEFLKNKLEQNKEKSIMEQNLQVLSEGLEGRSKNPVSLLFDTLNHPRADMGDENPSVMTWIKNPKWAIDHIVLGKGIAGGIWKKVNGGALTISLSSWMELPSMSILPFVDDQIRIIPSNSSLKRVTVHSVGNYYSNYVKAQRLEQYFRDHAVVTSVSKMNSVDKCPGATNNHIWKVTGHFLDSDEKKSSPFSYITPNVVLATGSSDQPNMLNIEGENLPFVMHSISELENSILKNELSSERGELMIVGAGLSAADAVILAHSHSVSVVHVFRCSVHDPKLVFNELPENVYPEYHNVHQMMQSSNRYEGYKTFPQHEVQEIKSDKTVFLKSLSDNHTISVVNVTHIVVLIGTHPDLSFLPAEYQNLGKYPNLPIDCKKNPVAIDVFTHESIHHPGLYAVGPLVGDNFVRFVQGGSLAVASHIWKKNFLN